MNKKEKEILEKRVLESELECLEAEEDMKSDKSKQARMLAMEKKMRRRKRPISANCYCQARTFFKSKWMLWKNSN